MFESGTLFTADPTIGYFPNNALHKATLGNGLVESNVYNSRLQPCRMNVNSANVTLQACGDPSPSGNVLDFVLNYGSTANNGNILTWNGTGSQTFARTFTYDNLNRLSTMSDSVSTQPCRGITWTYDPWGNRTDQTVTVGSCFTFHQSMDVQNRLIGFSYDAAGNLLNDGTHSYSYDAENRMLSVDGGGTATFVNDAEGRRVQKTSGGQSRDYIFDVGGNVVAETVGGLWRTGYVYLGGSLLAQYRNGTTYFAHTDHLGSIRMLTDPTKANFDSVDFMPFGEQLAGDSGSSHKFTGKERDSESNLDFFGARYYGSSMGRFMTPDWAGKATAIPYADFVDPQTLNLYGYVRNNPLSKADADGHCYPWCTVIGGAIIGGAIGGGGEIIGAKLHGQSIDWKKVEGSAVKGAVTGAAIGLAGPEAGVAATAALGAGGNVVGGVADRTIQGQSAKEVLSPTEVAKDAASGAVGGAIGGAKVGEVLANESAKVAAASGDQAFANFYSNNASAIGTGVAKAIDLGQSTAESYHDQSNQQQQKPQQQQQQQTQCSDRTNCH